MPFGFWKPPLEPESRMPARHAYEALRNLLDRNSLLLEQMAELESDLRFTAPESPPIRRKVSRLADEVLLLVEDLHLLSRARHEDLLEAYGRIRSVLETRMREAAAPASLLPLTLALENAPAVTKDLAGEKAFRLAQVSLALPGAVPPGFVATTVSYWEFLHAEGLWAHIIPVLKELEVVRDPHLSAARLESLRNRIQEAPVPESLRAEILRQASARSAPSGWAVRSSACGEDGRFSFAGQFTSVLHVPLEHLHAAYRQVILSRFENRAVAYREALHLEEIDTPMAVLFLAMVPARSAGVVYTRDPADPGSNRMWIQSVWGLAEGLVSGRMPADRFVLARTGECQVLEEHISPKPLQIKCASPYGTRTEPVPTGLVSQPSLTLEQCASIRDAARRLEDFFQAPLDIEWVLDPDGALWVVQARPLVFGQEPIEISASVTVEAKPLLEGGTTIQAGKACGPVVCVPGGRLPGRVPEGSILVLPAATPDISALIPHLAGCIAEAGNPAGHAATLLRESRVPSLFGASGALAILARKAHVSLDATNRKVYEGILWPHEGGKRSSKPADLTRDTGILKTTVFSLNLTDPSSPRFHPSGCASFHDLIRFVHEKAVETQFEIGDAQSARSSSRGVRLKSDIPIPIVVLDLGGSLDPALEKRKAVEASEIRSVPFQALWRGVTDPKVSWAGRREVSVRGFASVLVATMGTGGTGRGLGEQNYLLVAPDYLNLNLRLAYHYAMVDALVGESPDNNFINFRFRGGGSRADRRELRARFLSEVLLRSQFCTDRRGDLVTAWLRRYPRARCEEALALLGRLMACSRQMDMLIGDVRTAHEYAQRFLSGEYEWFR